MLSAQDEPSPATKIAYEKFQTIDYELGYFGGNASELILNCSYLQDILLAFLHDAETQEEYHRGMQLFQENSHSLKSVSNYITSVFNFYTARSESPCPQMVKTHFKNKEVWGFLNTFKINRDLSTDERAHFFEQEHSHFLRDATVYPFTVTSSQINELEVDTIYNFVVLPDGTIRASIERPGDREYHVRDEVVLEAFKYPNHTILAGHAEQVVVAAGALIVHQVGNKRLYFVSCKSGHFQPTYSSLEYLRLQLAEHGVNPCTVVAVPDIDMSRAVIKTYKGAQVPVLLTQKDAQQLFDIASHRWDKAYHEIDRNVIATLASGDTSALDEQLKMILKKQRAEATYMRSAYRLFAADHQPPKYFGELVKRFGKLKDAIKHYASKKFRPERVQEEAALVLDLIDKYEQERTGYTFVAASDASVQKALSDTISEIEDLLARDSLNLVEYHQVKKLSRETGALFMYMAHDAEYKGRGFFIYRTASEGFFQINDLMASTDYTYAEGSSEQEPKVILPRKIANQLIKYISHLGIAPATFRFIIEPKEAWWIINNSKAVYSSSKQVQDIFYAIAKGQMACHELGLADTLLKLKTLKRDLECARDMLVLLDITHKAPDGFETLLDKIDCMIDAVTTADYGWIQKEAYDFFRLCYDVPSSGLQNWQCTDQSSFDETLHMALTFLGDLQTEGHIRHSRATDIMKWVQAVRDFINLNRRNGLFRGEIRAHPHLPMVCFDALQERLDALLNEMEKGLCADGLVVTPDMTQNATFILSRIARIE